MNARRTAEGRLPVFVECLGQRGAERLRIVAQVRAQLLRCGHAPLPFAGSMADLQALMVSMHSAGRRPGLFVVNTFGAERDLERIDALLGQTPVLFFRREFQWLKEHRGMQEGDLGVTQRVSRSSVRPTALWYYGGKNAAQLAGRASQRVAEFLSSGDFRAQEGKRRVMPVRPSRIGLAV